MARSKQSKEIVLERLQNAISKSVSIVFASVKGLHVHELENFRKALRSENNECIVAKKTLLSRAFSSVEQPLDFKNMEGEVAAVFGYADQVAPARILTVFRKQHEQLIPLSGFLKDVNGVQVLNAAAVTALALLPSRDELRAKIAGSLSAPLRNCVGVLKAPLRGFVQVLHAYAQTKS